MVNKHFILGGIKNLLKKNYGIDPNSIDLEAEIDSTLTYGENWRIIKEKINAYSILYNLLKCLFCNYPIREGWIYCPKCAKPLKQKDL